MKALLYRNIVILVYVLLLPLVGFAQRAGDLDRSFNYGRGYNYQFNDGYGANGTVRATATQPDGKVIIGGGFNLYHGTTRNGIARLNHDGSLDTTFNPGTGTSPGIIAIALQPDGKIIIGGNFYVFNYATRNTVARLNADGSLDSTFNPGSGAGRIAAANVSSIALQPNGKIIIGGEFTSFNGTPRNRIARLNADGTLDATFNPGAGANALVLTTALQADGKIIIGGGFTTYNGTARNYIARLNTDGSLDATFNPSTGASGRVNTTAVQADGKIIIGGIGYGTIDGIINRIARLNADGSFDSSFNSGTGANDEVQTLVVQTGGKIIIGGRFNAFNNIARNYIARLNADGSLDTSFNIGTGANFWIITLALQTDGKIILGGSFTTYNGTARNYIARLNTEGSIDTSFILGTGANDEIRSFALQPDGKILVGGYFSHFNGISRNRLARLNTDGSLDTTFNARIGSNSQVRTITPQPDLKILVGGFITSVLGTTRIVRLNVDGSIDATFNPHFIDDDVYSTVIQPDGKIILGGTLGAAGNNLTTNTIVRLNSNGSFDENFRIRTGMGGVGQGAYVKSICLQPDGKIIIGGYFTRYDYYPIPRENIARLNADGSLDLTFYPRTGANGDVQTISYQPDGKIIIGGNFTRYNGRNKNYIARLNNDGSLDSTFNLGTGPSGGVATSALQPDGKIIIGGVFSSYNGTTINKIARLNSDGSLDTTFKPRSLINNVVRSLALQPDNKITIQGDFNSISEFSTVGIARIHGVDCPTTTQITIEGDSVFCHGESTILTSSLINGNLWSTGDTTRSIVIRNSGTYTVRSMNNGCTTSFSGMLRVKKLNEIPIPSISLVDTMLCPSNPISLTSSNLTGNLWSTGDTTRSILITTPGEYSVRTIRNSCTSSVSRIIRIAELSTFVPVISGDSIICNGSNLTLSSSSLTGNLWSTGDTTHSITVSTPGNYSVRIIYMGCSSLISNPFEVIIQNPSQSSITQSICEGNFLLFGSSARSTTGVYNDTLANSFGCDSIVTLNLTVRPVSSTSITQSICQGDSFLFGGLQRTTRGIYYDTLVNTLGCDSIVNLNLTVNQIPFTPTITGNATFCSGNTSRLASSSPIGNLWNTGDTTRFINVVQAGSYSVRVINSGCSSEVSAPFRVVNDGPSPTAINFDTTSNRCLGARLQLTPAGTFDYYQWNTGARTRSIFTRTSGQYSVQVANSDVCFGLPSPPIFIAFDTNWCTVEIFRMGIDSITASVWADYYIWYLDGIELLSSNTLKTIPIQGDGVYIFRAVTAGRTSPLSNPIVITSGKKSLATKFEVYPNPATQKVTINTIGTGTLEILNTLGQVVITQPATATNELSLTHLAKGVYTVRFNGASKMLVVK